jgi:hypothetical protein
MLLFGGELCLSKVFAFQELRYCVALCFRILGVAVFCQTSEVPADDVSACRTRGFRHIDRFLPRVDRFGHTATGERLRRALADGSALHDGLSVRYPPPGIVQRDCSDQSRVQFRSFRANQLGGELPGQRGMGRLRNHPATIVNFPLCLFHHAPDRQKFSAAGGNGIEWTQNHQLERLLAMRRGTAIALAGPLLEGGFFIPSRSSLSATALFRSESFDA